MYSKVLASFLLFIAVGISASVLPAPLDQQDEDLAGENGDKDISDDTEDLMRRPVTIDYRQNTCMPSIKEAATVFDKQHVDFFYTPYYVMPLVMAEYIDCTSSSQKVLRDFSLTQLEKCLYKEQPDMKFFAVNYNQQYVLNYILYTGLSLTNDYDEAVQNDMESGTFSTCVRSMAPLAYNFKYGYRTLPQLNETYMQRVIKSKGPILATMYFDSSEIDDVSLTSTQDPISLSGYTSGVFDHETFCVPSVKDPKFPDSTINIGSRLYTKGFPVPVMIVGFTKQNDVPVWIVRSDWFGEKWGMKGHLYLKRGVNACNIALSPIRVLG